MTQIAPSTVHAGLDRVAHAPGWRGAVRAYIETTKPGITKLVTITSMVGMGLALAQRWADSELRGSVGALMLLVAGCIAGTALSAAGANALNQWAERERDARMPRTQGRPIPTGRLSPRRVLAAGLTLVGVGLSLLWALCGLPAMLVSAACVLVYVLVYTPMKSATWTATLVGAIPGALPPLIGWSAAYADLGFGSLGGAGGWSLFTLMFIWQLPHFLAIAWMYRDDYALGGCAVLPVVDRSGRITSLAIAFFTLLLIPATLAPALAMPGVVGLGYVVAAVLSGLAFGGLVIRLLRSQRRDDAKRVFIASIIHLPVLLAVLVCDAFLQAIL